MKYVKQCACGRLWEYEDYEIWVEPWPHFVCPVCGHWIPVWD